MYGLGLFLIVVGGCCLDSVDLRIPVALILLGAGTCLIKYIKLHRCNRRENVYKLLFGKKSDRIGITLDTNEIGLGVLCSKSSAGGWVDIAIFILHIYITW